MAKIYANLIIHERRTINTVPEDIREAVIEELNLRGYDENGDPLEE